MINIMGLMINHAENFTKVTVEVTEMIGTMQRIKDRLIVTLPGKHQSIDEELIQLVDAELNRNGYEHNPTVG